ncbi:hypothetical protein L6R52_14495 [Myxococcota bacterium]|nr:hypothetical protein [Myxococcota bacterium]
MDAAVQELFVFAIVGGAALYLFHRVTGLPRLRAGKSADARGPNVQLGARLERGLARARTR